MSREHNGVSWSKPMHRPLVIQELTAERFKPFGLVVETPEAGFSSVLLQPEAAGWQAAINRVMTTHLESLHYHPDTWECFSPLDARLAIAVAPPGMTLPSDARAVAGHIAVFNLNVPVCVAPKTWHSLLWITTGNNRSGSETGATAFVCENAHVRGVTTYLDSPIAIAAARSAGGMP